VPYTGSENAQRFHGRHDIAHASFEAELQIKVKTYRYEPRSGRDTLTQVQFRWISSLLIAVGLGSCAALALAQTDPPRTKAAAQLTPRDGQHDFDFIFGHWKVRSKRREDSPTGADIWAEFDGYSFHRKVWDGRANLDEFEAHGPSGRVEGLTLRTYDPKTRQWSLYSANSQDGILGRPKVGRFQDGVGEFYAQDKLDGMSILIRHVWSKVAESSVHFEQAFSYDGGKTWDVNWISDMVRIADAPANAFPASAARDGQRDFDPLVGSWNYRLKRRTNPLTGSTTWVDLTGTGTCYRLWGGRAQLDTIVVNGPSGRIEGLTLRLYDPKTHQWRLYWANSNSGVVDPPQIGQFRNGRGEFYAQDILNGKSIFVRFDWTGLTSKSPHFEQAFSDDGGKTWEVNWITDQTRLEAPTIED
jgi:hypothetical protein